MTIFAAILHGTHTLSVLHDLRCDVVRLVIMPALYEACAGGVNM